MAADPAPAGRARIPVRFGLRLTLVVALALLLLAGCRSAPGETPAAPTGTLSAPIPPTETAPLPTATPTPEPLRVLLLRSPESDPGMAALVEGALDTLAPPSGVRWESRESLAAHELTENVPLVIVLPPDPGVAALAAGAPETTFLTIGVPGVEPGPNLTVVGSQGFRPDQQAFLAGYLAAIITSDWRVGVITAADTPAGAAAREGFINGVVYFCGLCRPISPPFQPYPLAVTVAAGTGEAGWRTAAEQLVAQAVETVYVAPALSAPGLIGTLDAAGLRVIAGTPRAEGEGDDRVATVRPAPEQALESLWPELLVGEGDRSLPMPLTITDVGPGGPSLGRLGLAEALIPDLIGGLVDTGVDPLTGERRGVE